jgi:hypothetical protein
MQLPGFTATNSLPSNTTMLARINVGGIFSSGLSVMTNPDCYCADEIWVCDRWSCKGVCIRWVCP